MRRNTKDTRQGKCVCRVSFCVSVPESGDKLLLQGCDVIVSFCVSAPESGTWVKQDFARLCRSRKREIAEPGLISGLRHSQKCSGMEVNMNQYCELTDDCMVIHIPRELDHHEAGRLRQEADLMIGACHIRRLVFDFAETEFMDSSGIGVIIGRCRTIGYYGGSACARNLSGRLRKIFLVSGLQELMREDQTGKTERKESEKL